MSETVRTSRRLYVSALADAIDWTESLMDTHDPQESAASCCQPGTRCEAYQQAAKRLADYKRAYTRAQGGPGPLEAALTGAEAAPLHELQPSDHFVIGVDGEPG